jgi:hypothetical protein
MLIVCNAGLLAEAEGVGEGDERTTERGGGYDFPCTAKPSLDY